MNSTLTDGLTCPRCGAVMEPIESTFEELEVEQLRLCPACYLVLWRDANGLQYRQGTPVRGVHRIVES